MYFCRGSRYDSKSGISSRLEKVNIEPPVRLARSANWVACGIENWSAELDQPDKNPYPLWFSAGSKALDFFENRASGNVVINNTPRPMPGSRADQQQLPSPA
jgi:hypothetical protein